jgi:hypothetical protein
MIVFCQLSPESDVPFYLAVVPEKSQVEMPGLQKEHSVHVEMVQVDMLVKESEPLVDLDAPPPIITNVLECKIDYVTMFVAGLVDKMSSLKEDQTIRGGGNDRPSCIENITNKTPGSMVDKMNSLQEDQVIRVGEDRPNCIKKIKSNVAMHGLQKEHSGHKNKVQVDMLVEESKPLVALDNEVVDQETKKLMNVGIENLAPRKVLKGKRGKKDGLVQTKIDWFLSLRESQVTQVEQARQPKRKQGDMLVSKNTITKRQRKK